MKKYVDILSWNDIYLKKTGCIHFLNIQNLVLLQIFNTLLSIELDTYQFNGTIPIFNKTWFSSNISDVEREQYC